MGQKPPLYLKLYMLFVIFIGNSGLWFQALHLLKTKSSRDISILGMSITLWALVSWSLYGYTRQDKLLMWGSLWGAIGALLTVIFGLTYG